MILLARRLTEKQKRFVDEYLIDLNGSRAYRAAYLSCKKEETARVNASRLLTKANVKDYIATRMAEKNQELIASQDEVLQYLTNVMRGDLKEDQVIVEGLGEGVSSARIVQKQVGAKDRNKAAELLGKRYSLFSDKLELSGQVPVTIIDDIDEQS